MNLVTCDKAIAAVGSGWKKELKGSQKKKQQEEEEKEEKEILDYYLGEQHIDFMVY